MTTNVYVYALDHADLGKQALVRALLKSLQDKLLGVVSTQVFQEFFVVATSKLKLEHQLSKKIFAYLANFKTVTVDLPIIKQATDICSADYISLWNALIIASAKASGYRLIWTEGLNHEQVINCIRIENPFLL
ncbi:MAG: PIN domain-containing protein [Dethiobacteria bacterium]